MHYFIFSDEDTTLYQASSSLNSGMDEILEVRKDVSDTGITVNSSRVLIKFDLTYVSQSVVSGIITSPKYYLNLYDAHPTNLSISQSLYAFPVSQSWVVGEGHSYDSPINKEGASWNFKKGEDDGTLWNPELSASGGSWWVNYASGSLDFIEGFGMTATASNEVQLTIKGTEYNFVATASINADGTGSIPSDSGVNYYFSTGSSTSDFNSNLVDEINSAALGVTASYSGVTLQLTASSIQTAGLTDISVDTGSSGTYSDILTLAGGGVPYRASQSINQNSTDIRMDVTEIVAAWVSGSIDNEGFIVKRLGNIGNTDKFSDEGNTDRFGNLSFFSSDTHTKYPPTLEVVWDDHKRNIGSLQPITGSDLEDMVIYMKGLRPEYKQKSKARFRVVGRTRFPAKTYSTTPSNLTVKALPSQSYYSITDAETEDVVVPFGSGSILSLDGNGNYFNLWFDGYQPERYYTLRYRVVSGSNTADEIDQYFDEGFTFKVTL